jgi:hypothetical protein
VTNDMNQEQLFLQFGAWFSDLSGPTLIYLGIMVLVAVCVAIETAMAAVRSRKVMNSDWSIPTDDLVKDWFHSVMATLHAGSSPTDGDVADFFDERLGYRFERARAVAASLMVLGLLGTFLGMAVALQQSSDAMVALQEQFSSPLEDTSASNESEQAQLDRLRDEIDREMNAATSALGNYVEGQQRAIGGMALGVSTSIVGIVLALMLLAFIGVVRRAYDLLVRHAHQKTVEWIGESDTGLTAIVSGFESLPADVANATASALVGLNEKLAVSLGKSFQPMVEALSRVELVITRQTEILQAMQHANGLMIDAAANTVVAMRDAATESKQSAITSRESFKSIAESLRVTADEIKEFRDGFEEYIGNSRVLAQNYETAGKRFEVISNALQTIEENHGALNTSIQKLDMHVMKSTEGVYLMSTQLQDTATLVVSKVTDSVEGLKVATEDSVRQLSGAVNTAVIRIAEQAGATGAEAARAVAPIVAREVSRGVLERLKRRNWWGRLLDRLDGSAD